MRQPERFSTHDRCPSFHNGAYLSWNISGHVVFRFTKTGGANAVVSGLFFGANELVGHGRLPLHRHGDTRKLERGLRRRRVQRHRRRLQLSLVRHRVPVRTVALHLASQHAKSSALQKANPSASDRIAACWYCRFPVLRRREPDRRADPQAQPVRNGLGFDHSIRNRPGAGRSDRDGTGHPDALVVPQRHLPELEHQRARRLPLHQAGGANAVVSGFFFGGPPRPLATFLSTDTTTQGSWKGVYGADGYNIIGNASSYPSYATVTPSGQSSTPGRPARRRPRAAEGRPGRHRPDRRLLVRSVPVLRRREPDRRPDPRGEPLRHWIGIDQPVRNGPGGGRGDRYSSRHETLSSFHDGTYLSWNITGTSSSASPTWAATPSSAGSSSAYSNFGHVPLHGHDDARNVEGGLRRRRVQHHRRRVHLSLLRHRDPSGQSSLHLGGQYGRRCALQKADRRHRPDRRLLVCRFSVLR